MQEARTLPARTLDDEDISPIRKVEQGVAHYTISGVGDDATACLHPVAETAELRNVRNRSGNKLRTVYLAHVAVPHFHVVFLIRLLLLEEVRKHSAGHGTKPVLQHGGANDGEIFRAGRLFGVLEQQEG